MLSVKPLSTRSERPKPVRITLDGAVQEVLQRVSRQHLSWPKRSTSQDMRAVHMPLDALNAARRAASEQVTLTPPLLCCADEYAGAPLPRGRTDEETVLVGIADLTRYRHMTFR
jgi:hypothetical protein